MEKRTGKKKYVFAFHSVGNPCAQWMVVLHANGFDGLVSQCGVWVVIGFMKNVWMLYSVSVLRIERMLKIDSCSVWFASTTMKEKTTASNNMHIQKHIQLNALPQMLPSRFHFSIEWASTQQNLEKKSLLWTCCFDFVCVYFFLFLSLLHSPFFCVFELAFAIQSMRFPFVYLVFRMRFMCFKMKWARSMPPRAHFYSARKTPFSQTTVFPRGCRTVFCVEIWQKLNGSSELNWSILHNTARYRLLI